MLRINSIDETYLKGKNFVDHYEKHVAKTMEEYEEYLHTADKKFPPMSREEYNKRGHNLSQQPVCDSSLSDPHDVVGYFSIDGRVVKYQKSTGELVAYKATYDDQVTISYYPTLGEEDGHLSYTRKKKRDYLREIMPDDDYYNGMP